MPGPSQLSCRLAERLLARTGKSLSDLRSNSKVGQSFRASGVRACSEFERIKALPRRDWEKDPDLPEVIDGWTRELKTSSGTMVLRPQQAAVLTELHDFGCSLAAAKVSAGKTLLSFLSPTVIQAKRPLLLVPAKLVGKTQKDFRELAEHWNGCRTVEILSYEKLSLNKWSDFLERFQPDLIIADEAHKLRSLKSARTKRVKRYMKEHPETVFLPLSGTLKKKSILDYAHIAEWALKELSPVPRNWSSLDEWRRAIDEDMKEDERMPLGVLSFFGGPALQDCRDGYAGWQAQTPGWVSFTSGGVNCSLILSGERFDGFPAHVDDKFEALRADYQTPDGETFLEPQKLWQYLRQCSLGFWYRLDPKPPEEWKLARKAWGQFCRDIISQGRAGLDTELQVALGCAQGRVVDNGLHAKWKSIRGIYDPEKHKHTEWFDYSVVDRCERYLKEEGGIVATPFVAFGEEMRRRGWPYFHEVGCDKKFGSIADYKGGPCVVSSDSVREGFNLQDRWNSMMIVGGIGDHVALEQLIGRIHRSGQEADEVEVTFLYGALESLDCLWKARRQAKFADDPEHKLLISAWLVDSEEDATEWSGPRWQRKSP